MTKGQDGHEPGDEQRRVTRRAALATGAGAYAGSMIWAASSLAAASTPKQLLEQLRREILQSRVKKPLKPNLTTIIGDALTDLARGRNAAAVKVLEQRLIPVLQSNSGHHGLGARQAKEWVVDAKNVVSKIPGLGANGDRGVYVFNCAYDPVTVEVTGQSVGTIPGWSDGSGGQTPYTPAGLRVPRTTSGTPGGFAVGDNAATFTREYFAADATIKIPPPPGVPSQDDLVLFLSLLEVTLQDGGFSATFRLRPR
jgi:hypothetical protein